MRTGLNYPRNVSVRVVNAHSSFENPVYKKILIIEASIDDLIKACNGIDEYISDPVSDSGRFAAALLDTLTDTHVETGLTRVEQLLDDCFIEMYEQGSDCFAYDNHWGEGDDQYALHAQPAEEGDEDEDVVYFPLTKESGDVIHLARQMAEKHGNPYHVLDFDRKVMGDQLEPHVFIVSEEMKWVGREAQAEGDWDTLYEVAHAVIDSTGKVIKNRFGDQDVPVAALLED